MISLKTIRFSDTLPFLAFGACIALLIANVQLQSQNRLFYRQIEVLEASDAPAPGTHISTLRGLDLNGNPVAIDLSKRDQPALLYVMSPTCPACEMILPTWRSMAEKVGANNVIIVDLSGSLNRTYLKSANLDKIPSDFRINASEALLHGFRATPTTVLLTKNGTVDMAWAGIMDKQKIWSFNSAYLNSH